MRRLGLSLAQGTVLGAHGILISSLEQAQRQVSFPARGGGDEDFCRRVGIQVKVTQLD